MTICSWAQVTTMASFLFQNRTFTSWDGACLPAIEGMTKPSKSNGRSMRTAQRNTQSALNTMIESQRRIGMKLILQRWESHPSSVLKAPRLMCWHIRRQMTWGEFGMESKVHQLIEIRSLTKTISLIWWDRQKNMTVMKSLDNFLTFCIKTADY